MWFIESRSVRYGDYMRTEQPLSTGEHPLINGNTWNENRHRLDNIWDIEPNCDRYGKHQDPVATRVIPQTAASSAPLPLPLSLKPTDSNQSATSSFVRFQERFRNHMHKTERRAKIWAKVKVILPHNTTNKDDNDDSDSDNESVVTTSTISTTSPESPHGTNIEDQNVVTSSTLVATDPNTNFNSNRNSNNICYPGFGNSPNRQVDDWRGSTSTAVSEYSPIRIKDILSAMSSIANRTAARHRRRAKLYRKWGKLKAKVKRTCGF